MDPGISDAVFVRDFIVNRASRVSSIAINQNGRTMLVRADSIYAFNQTLGQTGLMPAGSGAVGMDFHPSNDFDANVRGTGGLGGTGQPEQPAGLRGAPGLEHRRLRHLLLRRGDGHDSSARPSRSRSATR